MRDKGYVLFLTPRFYPQTGGVEKHVLRVSQELINKGKRVVIITEAMDGRSGHSRQLRYISAEMIRMAHWVDKSSKNKTAEKYNNRIDLKYERKGPKKVSNQDIIVYRLPKYNKGRLKKFLIWLWFLKNKKIIQSANIVHCHDVFYWYLPLRFIYFKKPVYTTFHGYESYPIPLKNILIRKISEKLSWGNICVGSFIKKWYGTKPDFITYGAIDPGIKNQNSKISSKGGSASGRKNTDKKLKILFIGRLEVDLGILVYLSALELLKDRQIKFEFEVCGDGSLRKEAEIYGKVYGFVKDTGRYIEKADIIFSSSYLSILESLAFRKTVIAVYDNPLKEDYLKFTPFSKWINIIDSGIDMVNKIVHIKNNPVYYHKINKEAYEWVNKQTWNNIASLYISLWSRSN